MCFGDGDTQRRWTVSRALSWQGHVPAGERCGPVITARALVCHSICSGLNLNFSFLDHTMGLIRVPNSCVTEKRQSSLSSSQHRVWHMVGALSSLTGPLPLSLQAMSSSRSRRS